MRYVPISVIRSGMKLGQPLFTRRGEILLAKDVILNENYIERIKELGYNGIYVEDDISKDVEIVELISHSLKNEAVQKVKNTFVFANKGKANEIEKIKQIGKINDILKKLISDIMDNKNLMVNMIDLKLFDDYTFFHSLNVSVLSLVIGVAMKFDKKELYKLGLSGLLHDIGKVFIPDSILNKPEKLTEDELKLIQQHSEKGYRYLKDAFDLPIKTCLGVKCHHEYYDGTGYPNGLKGDDIFIYGRIIAVADVFDALTSDRVYRKALSPSEAIEYLMGNSGIMFDPKIVKIFLEKVAPYPVGTTVKLSNGSVGVVMQNFENFGLRPVVKVFMENNEKIKPYIINLKDNHQYSNITVLDIYKDEEAY